MQQGDGTGTATGTPVAQEAVLGGFTNLIMCSSNLPDKVAIALDVQMDDGTATTGAVRATDASSVTPAITKSVGMSTSGYVETGTTVYTLCRQF